MKSLFKNLSVFVLFLFLANISFSQCVEWNTLTGADKEKAEDAYVIFRDAIKAKDYDLAYSNWQIVYELAPKTNGKVQRVFSDGRKIFMHKYQHEADEAKKKEYADKVLALYDEQIDCFGNEPKLLGRKAYDMFYTFRSPYMEIHKLLQKSVKAGGNATEYLVFTPCASTVVYLFTNDMISKEEAREANETLNAIADYNIENNLELSDYYKQAKNAMNGEFAKIESFIFDCDYFKNKFEPEYRADPDNWELIKKIYNKLKVQGCAEDDPLVNELKGKYDVLVAEENAKRQAEHYAENPGVHALALAKEGNYSKAISKYKEAIGLEPDNEKKALYYLEIAKIQYGKLKSYSAARSSAKKAASLKKGWGEPYMLIGNMYVATSKKCGNDVFEQKLAILAAIDKWKYAKSIDPSIAGNANKKISKYRDHKPAKDEIFMRKYKDGSKVKVPCWIAETVILRL